MNNYFEYYRKSKIVFFTLIFLIFLIPRLIGLGFDEWNVDSHRWAVRSDKFISNVLSLDFKNTYQSYHPGVTLMYLSGTSKYIFYQLFNTIYKYSPKITSGIVYPEKFYIVSFISKFPIVVIISLVFTFCALLLLRLNLSKTYVLIYSILISLEPFYLGVTRFYHLTGLESAFTFSSVLTVFYSLKTRQIKYTFLSGIFLGLAFLTKSSSLILVPFCIILIFYYSYKEPITFFKLSAIYTVTALVVFYLLFPASWVDPINIIPKIYNNGVADRGFSDSAHSTVLNIKWLYYPELFLTKTTGINIILLVISVYLLIKSKVIKDKSLFFVGVIFTIYYCVIMSFPSKHISRYTAIIYPFIFLLIPFIYSYLRQYSKKVKAAIAIFLVFYYLLIFYSTYPNFSTFHSELVGGYNGISKIRRPYNDGEHFLQVAEYLNNKYGKDTYTYALVITEGNKDASVKYGFLGETFTGSIPANNKKYTSVFYASVYDDYEDFPTCPVEQTFGHRFPDKFDFIILFKCPGRLNK